jgi:4-hydroxybenzoate polyprenyltransferase
MKSLAHEVLLLCRPKNAVAPFLAVYIGFFAGGGTNPNNLPLLYAASCIVLLNFFATLQNDFNDAKLDKQAGRKSLIISGGSQLKQIKDIQLGILGVAIALAILIKDILVISVLSVYLVGIYSYNQKPLRLSYRPLASIAVLAFLFSGLPMYLGYILSQSRDSRVYILILGFLFLRFSISALKDFKDYRGDKMFNKRTMLVVFGAQLVRILTIFFSTVSLLLITLAMINLLAISRQSIIFLILSLIVLAYSIKLRFFLSDKKRSFYKNNIIFHQIVDVTIVFEAGVALCLYFY